MSSPTQRTLAECRRLGFQAGVVEKRISTMTFKPKPGTKPNPFSSVTIDLFGFIDILALGDGSTYAIQTTSTPHLADRKAKIESLPTLAAVLDAGWLVECWGWAKRGKRGKRKLWTLRRERLVGPGTWQEIPLALSSETCDITG
jgi:hypothetical protein